MSLLPYPTVCRGLTGASLWRPDGRSLLKNAWSKCNTAWPVTIVENSMWREGGVYADFIATQWHCLTLKHFRGKNYFRGYSYSLRQIQSNFNKYLYLPTLKIICFPFKLKVEVGHCSKTAEIKHCLWGSVFCFPLLMSFLVKSEKHQLIRKAVLPFSLTFVCLFRLDMYQMCLGYGDHVQRKYMESIGSVKPH